MKNFALFTVVIIGFYALVGAIKEASITKRKRLFWGFLCSAALTIIGTFAFLGLIQSVIK